MHAIKEKPVVVDGQIVIRPIMVVALTYDHRMLDGREAVTFLGEHSGGKGECVDLIPLNSAGKRVLGRPAEDVTALSWRSSCPLLISLSIDLPQTRAIQGATLARVTGRC
jgi:hypothetical protein